MILLGLVLLSQARLHTINISDAKYALFLFLVHIYLNFSEKDDLLGLTGFYLGIPQMPMKM